VLEQVAPLVSLRQIYEPAGAAGAASAAGAATSASAGAGAGAANAAPNMAAKRKADLMNCILAFNEWLRLCLCNGADLKVGRDALSLLFYRSERRDSLV
jgi:hypothetical protein